MAERLAVAESKLASVNSILTSKFPNALGTTKTSPLLRALGLAPLIGTGAAGKAPDARLKGRDSSMLRIPSPSLSASSTSATPSRSVSARTVTVKLSVVSAVLVVVVNPSTSVVSARTSISNTPTSPS